MNPKHTMQEKEKKKRKKRKGGRSTTKIDIHSLEHNEPY